jgi:hypothetical protein
VLVSRTVFVVSGSSTSLHRWADFSRRFRSEIGLPMLLLETA